MAYVPTYVHDVFVSYARVDNDGARWVTRFRQEIETELRKELAVWGARRIAVWFDENELSPGDMLSQSIQTALSKTAVLIRLLSPGYLSSAHCGQETVTFRQASGSGLAIGNRSRLLDVVIRHSGQLTPLLAESIYSDLSAAGSPAWFDDAAFPKTAFQNLTRSVADLLARMRAQCPAVFVSLPGPGHPLLEEKTTAVLEDLSQAGYRRTSETHPSHLSDALLANEIRSAVFSIHLIDDPDDDLVMRQVEVAIRAGNPLAVWLSSQAHASKHPRLDAVRSSGIEYSAENLSDFCERVKSTLRRITSGVTERADDNAVERRKIFVLFNPLKDRAAADSVIRRIEAADFDVARPGRGADRQLKTSHGVLLYQKVADDDWFGSKLRTLSGVRAVKAVCLVGPPPKDASREVARDYRFQAVADASNHDPRLLLEGDDERTLTPFFQAVMIRGA